jgi:hypothetical protein
MVVFAGACAAFVAAMAYAANQKWIEPTPRLQHHDPLGSGAPAAAPTIDSPAVSQPGPETMPSLPAQAVTPPTASPSIDAPAPQTAAPAASPTSTLEKMAPSIGTNTNVPSWAEVSEALSGGNDERAQKLLSDLARRGSDANDRAKAKLGLAQLEAAHGNCARARVVAHQVAATQGIDLKTVRRALELAEHCTR